MQGTQRKSSSCWRFFAKLDTTTAQCNECGKQLNCNTTANLKRHLAKAHPNKYFEFECVESESKNNISLNMNISAKIEETSKTKSPLDPDAAIDDRDSSSSSSSCNDDEKFFTVVNAHARKSTTWKYFQSIDEKTASCNICNRKLEYGSTISNLKRHLQIKHIADYKRLVNGDEPNFSSLIDVGGTRIKQESNSYDSKYSPSKTRTPRKRSNIWNYFKRVTDKSAICSMCDRHLSFGASPTNLRRHMKTKHPEEYAIMESESNARLEGKRERKTRNTSLNAGNQSKSPKEFRARGAKVWKYFERRDEKVALCLICHKKLYWGSAIGNLKRHMKLIHPKESETLTNRNPPKSSNNIKAESDSDDEVQENGNGHDSEDITAEMDPDPIPSSSNTQPAQNNNKAPTNDTGNSICLAQADNILMKLIIKHYKDYNVVEQREFISFVKTLNPSYKLPSKDSIASVIMPDLYEDCLFQTQLLVKSCKKVCMTVESWTNKYKTDFICVTIHFLDEHFNLTSVVLKCLATDASVPENIETELRRILNDWNILEDNIVLSVTGNANIRTVFTSINWDHFDCFAYTMNTIIENIFKRDWIAHLVNKSRRVVNYIKGCEMALEKLKEYQRNSSADLKLTKDIQNCWISTLFMLQRFSDLEEAIKYTLVETQSDVSPLTNSDWQTLRQLIRVLKPIENVISTIKFQSYFLASLVIPLVNGMRTLYNNFTKKQLFNNTIMDVLHCIVWGISEHFSTIENSEALTVATFLDPRFKYFAFSDESTVNRVKNDVIKILTNNPSENNCNSAIENNHHMGEDDEDSSIWSSFDKSVSTRSAMNESNRVLIEVQRYVEDGLLSRSEDPLKWWRTNKVVYPRLANLVQERFCIVASSIPCDRLFTKTGSNTMDNRYKLSAGKAEMFAFLNANYK